MFGYWPRLASRSHDALGVAALGSSLDDSDETTLIDLDQITRLNQESVPLPNDDKRWMAGVELVTQNAAETNDRVEAGGNNCRWSRAVVNGLEQNTAS